MGVTIDWLFNYCCEEYAYANITKKIIVWERKAMKLIIVVEYIEKSIQNFSIFYTLNAITELWFEAYRKNNSYRIYWK